MKKMSDDQDSIKVILIGDSGTGKTNLITRAAGYEFDSNSLSTTSCSYIQKTYMKHNVDYKINIWDTIGQEKFRSLTKIFVKESKIVILVYDITNKETFESLPFWKKLVDEILDYTPIFAIVGNKMDLYDKEQVKGDEADKYAESIGAKVLLTSAKRDSESFSNFVGGLLEDYLSKGKAERIDSFVLDKPVVNKKKSCC